MSPRRRESGSSRTPTATASPIGARTGSRARRSPAAPNDLHGPYLGPDGWIYWCKGAFAKQTYERPGKKPFDTRAAHIFRARPDGTGIEPVMTGGMDNPVDVVFTPGGERIFSTTFLQRPGGGFRDGLIHAIYGGIYGKDQEVIYEPPRGPARLDARAGRTWARRPRAGCTAIESARSGANISTTCSPPFNLRKVSRHVLKPSGATFDERRPKILWSPTTPTFIRPT